MAEDEQAAPAAQEALASKALDLKNAGVTAHHPASERTSRPGMIATPNQKIAPSGALNAEGHRPVLERSRKVR